MQEHINIQINNSWNNLLSEEMSREYFVSLIDKLTIEYSTKTIYPPSDKLLYAFHLTPYEKVKVVIIGQDPYHEQGEAQGLAFSVPANSKLPPSLRNIYKEIVDDIGMCKHNTGDLTSWAEQGVLLINSVLSVEEHSAGSHRKIGWEQFTTAVIKILAKREEPIIFILWGADARAKRVLIPDKHIILESAHPSPLSSYRGFFGNKHFSKCNEELIDIGLSPIEW